MTAAGEWDGVSPRSLSRPGEDSMGRAGTSLHRCCCVASDGWGGDDEGEEAAKEAGWGEAKDGRGRETRPATAASRS